MEEEELIKEILKDIEKIPIRYNDGYEDYIRTAIDYKTDIINLLNNYIQ